MTISYEEFEGIPDDDELKKKIVDSTQPYSEPSKRLAYTKEELFEQSFDEDLKEKIGMDDFNKLLVSLVKNSNLEKKGKYYYFKCRVGHEEK